MRLPSPPPPSTDDAVVAWVSERLGDLALEGPSGVSASPRFRGGQTAADAALAAWDVAHYARRRNQVAPETARGASGLSPYIRHGLLRLDRLWEHVASGPAKDRQKFRDELLWQEYARHVYARLGAANGRPLRHAQPPAAEAGKWEEPWPRAMRCMDFGLGELERDGWVVNQARMWMASQWVIRAGADWRVGEDRFWRHLLDGSRAANRLGWQWTGGMAIGRPYGFSRRQVEKRAPSLCASCALRDACPIEEWPAEARGSRVEPHPSLLADPDPFATRGPAGPPAGARLSLFDEPVEPVEPVGPVAPAGARLSLFDEQVEPVEPSADAAVDGVWLTAESLGDADPALAAHPDAPAVFVFDEPFLARARVSGKRLVFLAETLGDLATRRPVEVWRGDPVALLRSRRLAATHTPVPGWRRRAAVIAPAAIHPWPWLVPPHGRSALSYTAWRKAAKLPR